MSPASDDARLVYADSLLAKGEGPRAELVVVQCELARGGFDRARGAALRRREHELLAMAHEWVDLGDFATGAIFRRGFVDEVTIDAEALASHQHELRVRAPFLRWVNLTGLSCLSEYVDLEDPARQFHRIRPTLERALPGVRYVSMQDAECIWTSTLVDPPEEKTDSFAGAIARWLCESRRIGDLRGLRLRGSGHHALAHLVRTPEAAGLEELVLEGEFGHWREKPDAFRELCDRAPFRPVRLGLVHIGNDPAQLALASAVTERVTDLELGCLFDRGKFALADLPLDRRIRRLSAAIYFSQSLAWLSDLANEPLLAGLEELSLREVLEIPRKLESLSVIFEPKHFDALRVLRLDVTMEEPAIEAFLASSLGRQLEALVVNGRPYSA